MSSGVEFELEGLFAASEQLGSCLVATGEDGPRIRRALCRRVAAGSVVSPVRGMFARAEYWSSLKKDQRTLHVARGLQALHPSWVFCGVTAAVAWGFDVSWSLQDRIHIATTPSMHTSAGPVVTRHAILDEDDPERGVHVVAGLRVTSPMRSVFDCIRFASFPLGLGVLDSALRSGLVTREGFAEYVESSCGAARGKGQALGTLSWADQRSENGGESIARAHMILLGYVAPELQVEVPKIVDDGKPYRADFCWIRADGLVILGELDGTDKYVDEGMTQGRTLAEVLSDENVRGSRISLYDVSILRFPFSLTEDPARFAALLDEYGVPKRGSELALPQGARMIPDWPSLIRNR